MSKKQIPSRLNLPSGKLLLAFSGGSDSLCLLYLLSLYAKDRSEAIYVNHRIREDEELASEIRLNIENADKLGIRLNVVSLERNSVESLSLAKNIGIEAAARELRYRELESFRESNGFDYILTAHHSEDQCETVLMRILQSSPFYTYRGILREDGHIIRPMLDFSKAEILSMLSSSGLSWSEDSTNADDSYLRNKIRHSLMPLISQEERSLILKISQNVAEYRKHEESFAFSNPLFVSFKRDRYLSLSPHMREELIYAIFSAFGVSGRVGRGLIKELDEKIDRGSGRYSINSVDFFFLKNEFRAYKTVGSYVKMYDDRLESIGPFSIFHDAFDEKDLRIDFSALSAPVVIRTSLEGDKIALKGGSKNISDMERELHVPYSIVIEDREGIAAVFSRFLGGKDRLAERLLNRDGKTIRIGFFA